MCLTLSANTIVLRVDSCGVFIYQSRNVSQTIACGMLMFVIAASFQRSFSKILPCLSASVVTATSVSLRFIKGTSLFYGCNVGSVFELTFPLDAES